MSKCFEKSKTENNWDLFFYLRIFKQFHSQTWFPLQTAQLCRIADINYGVWGNNEENVVQQRKTYANPTDCFMNLLRKISSFCLASLRSFVKCLPINFKDALRLVSSPDNRAWDGFSAWFKANPSKCIQF